MAFQLNKVNRIIAILNPDPVLGWGIIANGKRHNVNADTALLLLFAIGSRKSSLLAVFIHTLDWF